MLFGVTWVSERGGRGGDRGVLVSPTVGKDPLGSCSPELLHPTRVRREKRRVFQKDPGEAPAVGACGDTSVPSAAG